MKKMDLQLILLIVVGVSTIVLSISTHLTNKKKDDERDRMSAELAEKTNKIIELQDTLIKVQKEQSDYLTGGDGYPFVDCQIGKNGKVIFWLLREGSPTIYNVRVQFTDPEIWNKLSLKSKHSLEGALSAQKYFHIDELGNNAVSLHKDKIKKESELTYGFFLTSRNGNFQQITTIQRSADGKTQSRSILKSVDGKQIKDWVRED